ncbi:histidinol-phosphate transaminase [Croceitalea vernalis]|uniref:Histidinol-phosphate aminotransferase n=1 Tax=Croceitalea vernalis TaxID=3075599 RepID=A0ABU3BH39_9FLAO|nr:histidinol-phosphate transaminase [Croceitalea sp. P007]MDT0621446.1 histidinol-phosphate transaminase [Croceitalea sp. P007]
MGFNLENITRENIKGLKPYSSARDEYVSKGSEMVFLDANENPNSNGFNRYPDPHQRSLKSILANQKNIEESQILVGNGSDEILDLLFRVFCEPKIDNIITLPPTYGMYKVLAGINDIENREVFLNSDFQPNIDTIVANVDDKTKLLLLCSPNNPTGNLIEENKIKILLKEFKGLVIIDEAYIDFASATSWIDCLNEYPNLVVTQTLSKAYGMAGIRLGMCYASEAIINLLKKIKPPYNVNVLTQNQAIKGVLNMAEVANQVAEILNERSHLQNALEEVPFIQTIYSSEANFLLVKVDDANKRYHQLLEREIVIRNRSKQPLCDNTLRFTIGTPEENIKLINALKAIK